jgi:hypothetical protein
MEFMITSNLGILAFVSAVISAKWAMDLGCSQARQIIWFVAGLLLGPLAMLILYVRLLGVAPEPAKRWF